jgi:hypothetical protein
MKILMLCVTGALICSGNLALALCLHPLWATLRRVKSAEIYRHREEHTEIAPAAYDCGSACSSIL